MKKSDFQKSTRLKNLEMEMVSFLTAKTSTVDLQTLKENFDRRASIQTTKSIVKISEYIDHKDLTDIKLNAEVVAAGSYSADIHCTVSGTNLLSVRVGGKSVAVTGGIARNVNIVNDTFVVDVTRTGSNNTQWTFTTDKIQTDNGDKKGDPSPVTRTSKSVTIKVI